MYMKISKFCLILSLSIFVLSCFSDKTTDATRPISDITIESGIDSIYNIFKNDTLVIKPKISQTDKSKTLSYTWEIDLVEDTCHDEVFTYVGNTLGKFNCRLIVSNEDGKSFFPFIIYVNTPYEEGITVLSKDANGKSMLSFMQTPMEGDSAKFVNGDCFAINNPKINFASNVADLVQCSGSLILACQGGADENDLPTIYFLNEKTLVVENMFTVPEYDDFKPMKMGVPSTGYSGTSYPILCENGKVYDLSTAEGVVIKPRKLQSTYEQNCIVADLYYYSILLWDKENSGLSCIYYGSGPYYCSSEYHLMLTDKDFASKNYFANRELVAMTKIEMTKDQISKADNRQDVLVISKVKNTPICRSEVVFADFWGYDFVELKPTFTTSNTQTGQLAASPIGIETPCVANKTFYTLLFADGNKVRQWRYDTELKNLSNANTLLTVGSENALITDFEISKDHLKTYVAFYEPDQEGLNGSVWVFDTDKGTVLEKYDNVCYQPVKMIYKN